MAHGQPSLSLMECISISLYKQTTRAVQLCQAPIALPARPESSPISSQGPSRLGSTCRTSPHSTT